MPGHVSKNCDTRHPMIPANNRHTIIAVAATIVILILAVTILFISEAEQGTDNLGSSIVDSRLQPPMDKCTFIVNGVKFTMLPVVGGTFSMGACRDEWGPYDDEYPIHKVTLNGFCMGETEVTQALWKAVLGNNVSMYLGNNRPVNNVSHAACISFINELNKILSSRLPQGVKFRLPTEAEWEYAARGGSQSCGHLFSGSDRASDVAWHKTNSRHMLRSVKQKKPNELGLYDMSGNVCEWCCDKYHSYSSEAQVNPMNLSGNYYTHRGGSWKSDIKDCRVSARGSSPGYKNEYMGFRLAF